MVAASQAHLKNLTVVVVVVVVVVLTPDAAERS